MFGTTQTIPERRGSRLHGYLGLFIFAWECFQGYLDLSHVSYGRIEASLKIGFRQNQELLTDRQSKLCVSPLASTQREG
jgi:hypothetical protein